MTDRFNQGALRIAVAQICQSMGWDALHKSTHDLLTDVMQRYMEEIAKSAYQYCQLYCHTEPNLDDLGLAFNDTGVLLNELEDYVTQVDQLPFIHQLPRFPMPKACILHHRHNGDILDRAEFYHEHLPPLIKALQPNEDEGEGASAENKELENGLAQPFLRTEIRTVAEETHNELVGNLYEKRSLESPSEFETETKRRRLEGPFLGKNNKENKLDILQALQENISPSPSPDILPMETDDKGDGGVFKFTSSLAQASKTPASLAQKKETAGKPLNKKKDTLPSMKSTETGTNSGVKSKAKPSPARKKSPQKASKPKAKPSPKAKSKTSSPLTSPLSSPPLPKGSPKTTKPAGSPKTPKKNQKVKTETASPISKVRSPPLEKKTGPQIKPELPIPSTKVEVPDKPSQTMPKLIIKPVKQEKSDAPEYSVSEMLSHITVPPEETKKAKKHKAEGSTPGEPKAKRKKKKEGAGIKTEPGSMTPGSSSMFSLANFLPSSSSTPASGVSTSDVGTPGIGMLGTSMPGAGTPSAGTSGASMLDAGTPGVGTPGVGTPGIGMPGISVSTPGGQTGDVVKKKKKKHKDKDKLKSKDKDRIKIKKIKQEPQDFSFDPMSTPSSSSTSIPRIKLKLEPPSAPMMTPVTTKESKKAASQKLVIHTGKEHKSKKASTHLSFTTPGPSHEPPIPVLHLKHEPDRFPQPKSLAASVTPNVTPSTSAGKDNVAPTVITETLSSTVQLYFCPACGLADDGSFMIGCDTCDKWYHGTCVGVLDDPGGDWFCVHCAAKKAKKKKKKKSKGKDKFKTM